MEPDFSGYATKAGLRCSDGRTITPEAFKHMDGMQVPLVWKHDHNSPDNILGHVMLTARPDGMWADAFFNTSPSGQNAKLLVEHGDIKNLSIYANQLVEKSKKVLHGMIREVSLVIAGANPGALIENVRIAHSADDIQVLDDEAIIHTGIDFELSSSEEDDEVDEVEHAEEKTAQAVYDGMDEEEKALVAYLVSRAMDSSGSAEHSDTEDENNEGDLEHQEGNAQMTRNVFDQTDTKKGDKHVLTHDAVQSIVETAKRTGSLKHAVQEYALAHGIENIDLLFPDAKAISDRPEFNTRRMEWVSGVLNGAAKRPFARIKSLSADLTEDDARAKGYITGEFKKEQFFAVSRRITTPTTVYKKQKLDRDDMIDITDFDTVAWLKWEMRFMLDEEVARAALIGDGRETSDEDKVKDPAGSNEGAGIRSIANDHELYATTVYVNLTDASSSYYELFEAILLNRKFYKGTGTPTFYTTEETLTKLLLTKDGNQQRYWKNMQELASDLRVAAVVPVEVMEGQGDLIGIIVNMADYVFGTDKGGEVNLFDDFDIDYNQYKYLIETRLSGALVKLKAALVIRSTATANVLVHPITQPTFVPATGVVTIPTQTGVVYKNADTSATLSAGAQSALAAGATLNVKAVPDTNYYFATNAEDEWSFTRPAA